MRKIADKPVVYSLLSFVTSLAWNSTLQTQHTRLTMRNAADGHKDHRKSHEPGPCILQPKVAIHADQQFENTYPSCRFEKGSVYRESRLEHRDYSKMDLCQL
jgi:hypothetical protein